MAEHQPPVWMQQGTYSAEDDRMVPGMLVDRTITDAGTLVGIEGGVVPPLDQLRVSAPGSGLTFSVTPGIVVVPAASTSIPGAYLCYNQGTYSGVVGAEGSSNPRIDLLVAKVSDTSTGQGTADEWHLTIKTGSPGVSPETPAAEANEIAIASIRVKPAAQNGGVNKITNADIVDLRNFVASAGGVHLHWGASPQPKHSPGRLMYEVNEDALYVNDGVKWNNLYTLEKLQAYFSTGRMREVYFSTATAPGKFEEWTATPVLASALSTEIAPIEITGVTTPSGQVRVTVTGVGKNGVATTQARIGVRVFAAGGTTPLLEADRVRGVAFYGTTNTKQAMTFVLKGLPISPQLLTVRVVFMKDTATTNATTNRVYFQNVLMQVEAVL